MSLGPNFFDMNPFDSARDATTLLDMLNNAKTAGEAAKIRALLEKMAVRICPVCKGTKQNRKPCETCKDTRYSRGFEGKIPASKLKAYHRDKAVPVMEECKSCKGMGCKYCNGKGQLYTNPGWSGSTSPQLYICPDCNGTSEVPAGECYSCKGTGMVR